MPGMPTSAPTPPSRSRLWLILGGAAIVALCACVVGGLGIGGYYFYSVSGSAAGGEPTVEYVLDASPRMQQPAEGGTRLSIAQAVLAEIVRPADGSVTAGLRVFGAGAAAGACQDTQLLVPLAPANQIQIAQTASSVNAGSSDSALGAAMVAAIRDLAKTKGPHTLVVVTGGADSCNAQASEQIGQEAERAGIQLQEFVIGFAVSEQEAQAIKGMIEAISGGAYLNAPDAATLQSILAAIQNYVDRPATTSLSTVMAAATPGAVAALSSAAPDATSNTAGATPKATPGAGGETPQATSIVEYQSQTACDHPYMPLRKGATWNYALENNSVTWTVDSVSGDLNTASAVVLFYVDGIPAESFTWTCSVDGIFWFMSPRDRLVNPFNPAEVVGATDTFTNQTGTTLPPVANLTPSATWNSTITRKFTADNGWWEMDEISESHTAGDMQSLSVGDNTYDVIPVISTAMDTFANRYDAKEYNQSYTIYFANGVGIVRIAGDPWPIPPEGYVGKIELVSYNIP